MDLSHRAQPGAVGDAGVAFLVARPLKQAGVRGRLCYPWMRQAAAASRLASVGPHGGRVRCRFRSGFA